MQKLRENLPVFTCVSSNRGKCFPMRGVNLVEAKPKRDIYNALCSCAKQAKSSWPIYVMDHILCVVINDKEVRTS